MKSQIAKNKTEKGSYNLIGRLISLAIGVIFLIFYVVYERISTNYSGHAMPDTSFILMWIVFAIAIIIGPLVGRIYGKLGGKS
jgi:hypothetical protein